MIRLVITVVAAIAAFHAFANQNLRKVIDESKACVYQGTNGKNLPYRLFSPNVESGKSYPLVVFLHGAGERGTNNISQLFHCSPLRLAYEKNADGTWSMKSREAFMIFPQCENDSKWALVPWEAPISSTHTKEPSPGLKNVHELVQKLQSELPIDKKRLYITGMSMGGYGTWDYIVRWPEEVAAAIVVCGGADDESIATNKIINSMPIRIFHGALDGAVPAVRGRSAFEALKRRNKNVSYTEYGGMGHGIWNRVYEEPFLGAWLFEQKQK